MKFFVAILGAVFLTSAVAEGSDETKAFTLNKGVSILEKTIVPVKEANSVTQLVGIKKTASGYEVRIQTFMPCSGEFDQPWLSLGPKASLVLQKKPSTTFFSNKEECRYDLKVLIQQDRLDKKDTLYVVNAQVVVGHVTVP